MTFVRGISKVLAEESCEFCSKGEHELCEYLLDLERLNQGFYDPWDQILVIPRKKCWCYRSSPEKHLDEDWEDDVDVQ